MNPHRDFPTASQQEILLSTHPLRCTPEMHSPVDSGELSQPRISRFDNVMRGEVPCDRQEYNVRMERQCKVEIGMDNLAGNGFKIALEGKLLLCPVRDTHPSA